ncbi:MAG: HEAT repeat domain-containing protein [bacterium]
MSDALARVQPTSGLASSLLRVIGRLGRPGVAALVQRALRQPALAPLLPRFRLARPGLEDPASALAAALAPPPAVGHRQALQRAASFIAAWPAVLDELWAAWGTEGRVAILDWLTEWLPLARAEHLVAGLADPADPVRRAAARLATLLVEPGLAPALAELAEGSDPAGREAAVRALAAWPHPAATQALIAASGDAEPAVAAAALFGLAGGPAGPLAAGQARAMALAGDAAGRALAQEAPFTPGAGDTAGLIALLAEATGPGRAVIIGLLGRHLPDDPRARERLIRLADGEQPGDQALAVRVLAGRADPTAGELLARALRQPVLPDDRLRLQEAAQLLGDQAVSALARWLVAEQPARLLDQLAVLRAQPFGEAGAALLRALDDARDGELQAAIGATLFVGGADAAEAIDEALRLPGQGLLGASLKYLAAYGTAEDLPGLMVLFDRHPPMRGIVLALTELIGPPAVAALEARIADGGDDAALASLERRLALLRATTDRPRRPASDA